MCGHLWIVKASGTKEDNGYQSCGVDHSKEEKDLKAS